MLPTLFLMYFSFLALLYVMQRNFLYFPGGDRPPIESLTQTIPETISVETEDGIVFSAWYWPAKGNKPTLVFFHGNGQAYQFWVNKAVVYVNEGYGAYFTDYRGYGGVDGKPTEEGIYIDARAHLKTLFEKKNLNPEDVIYYGESLGTGVAVQMAAEFQPKALILESAYTATSDVAKSRYWMFPVDILMKDQYRSIDKIEGLTMPKKFIHAKKDMVIPIRFGRNLYKAAPEPKAWTTIEKGGHNDLYDNGAQLHILEFLRTLEK